MDVVVLIGIVILGGMGLGWFLHRRSARQLTPLLKRLAAEENGVVQSQGPFVLPKLVFERSGTTVEVSSASTGTEGESVRYTYVLFHGMTPDDFEFRILPHSLQTLTDEWLGLKKPMAPRTDPLKHRLDIYTNNDRQMQAVLTEPVLADLLYWADGETLNRISDVRNYDDKLIYAVTGMENNHKEFRRLIDSACRFFDVVKNVEKDDVSSD